jgi:uncharacterized protein (DUF934 family)
MPLLENGRIVADLWVTLADDAPIPSDGSVLLSFERFRRDARILAGRNAPLGVQITNQTEPEELATFLDRLALIVIPFPKFRDGRGFTIARTLRERYDYKGEIRAVGHILPDQYVFLLRCGFTTVEIPEGADPARWAEALAGFDIAYQPSITDDQPLSLLRRRLAVAG